MEETKKSTKPSYEELEQGYFSILEEAKKIQIEANKKIQELQMFNAFKRIDYLFEVIKHPEMFNVDFVEKSSKEIEEFLTLPDEQSKEEDKNEGDK